jgi:hypothetical protein
MANYPLIPLSRDSRNAPNSVKTAGSILRPPQAHQYQHIHVSDQGLGNLESLGNNRDTSRFQCEYNECIRVLNRGHASRSTEATKGRPESAVQDVQCVQIVFEQALKN